MVVGHLLQLVDGSGEGQQFADARGELTVFLKLLVHEKVLPVGVVLDRSDAMRNRVFEGEQVAFEAKISAGRRNLLLDEVLGGFADDAGSVSIRVAVDLAALRVGRVAGDSGGGEGGGVGNGDVSVDADKEGRVIAADGVDGRLFWQRLRGPEGVVPSSAREPCAGPYVVSRFPDAALHVGERGGTGEIDRELGASCVAEMH